MRIRTLLQLLMLVGTANFLMIFDQPEAAETDRDLAGTISVKHWADYRRGKLSGCFLRYSQVYNDYTYRGGKPIIIDGSFGFMKGDNGVGPMLKLGAFDFGDDGKPKASLPSRIYIVGKNETNHSELATTFPSDDGEYLYAVFALGDKFERVYEENLESNSLKIAFNQFDGNSDIVIAVDLTVAELDKDGSRVHSIKAVEEFSTCGAVLMKEAIEELAD